MEFTNRQKSILINAIYTERQRYDDADMELLGKMVSFNTRLLNQGKTQEEISSDAIMIMLQHSRKGNQQVRDELNTLLDILLRNNETHQ